MKVVIAGGSGLIGTGLCRALSAAGHEVVILTRRTPGPVSGAPRFRAVRWDPPHAGPWTAEIANAGAVINLAGASIGRWPWTQGRKRVLRDSRLQATRALVDAIDAVPERARPHVFLSASGTDVYQGRDDTPAGEDTPPTGSFLATLCLDWEAEASRAEALGVRVVLLRTSSVIARGAPYLRVVSLPYRLLVGGRIGSGQQWVSWIDLRDAVGIYLLALELEAIRGPVNVTAPDPRRQVEFARALAGAIRRPSWFWTPAWIVRLLLRDQAMLALGSRRVWPAKAIAAGYAFERADLDAALANAV
jgi:hypothetical protein